MRFQPGINHRKWQLILIPIIAVIAANIIAYASKSEGIIYQFPWRLTLTLAFFTFIIWQVNIITYSKLDKTNAFFENPGRRLLLQIFYCIVATWVTYLILYNIVYTVLGGSYSSFPFKNFILFFFVSTGISLLVNSLYVIRYLQSAFAYKEAISTEKMNALLGQLSKQSTETYVSQQANSEAISEKEIKNSQSLLITSGSKMQHIPFSSMAYWYSSEGLVVLVLVDGKKITTNFSSYTEFISLLPNNTFFQLSRQFVAHIQSIHSIRDEVNRKLVVELKAPNANLKIESVIVSRYRSQQLKEWFVQHTK